MNQTGPEASGSFVVHHAGGAAARAEQIVTNPIVKLLASAIAGLCSLLALVVLAYVALKISTIDARLDSQDSVNVAQDSKIQELREWRAAVNAQQPLAEVYRDAIQVQNAQSAEFVNLIREIRDRLPPPKR